MIRHTAAAAFPPSPPLTLTPQSSDAGLRLSPRQARERASPNGPGRTHNVVLLHHRRDGGVCVVRGALSATARPDGQHRRMMLSQNRS